MEREENDLLIDIDNTKRKALEMIKIKKYANNHQNLLSEYRNEMETMIEQKHQTAKEAREENKEYLEYSRSMNVSLHLEQTQVVKSHLEKLREKYKIQQKEDYLHNYQQYTNIKEWEGTLHQQREDRLT